MSIFRSGISEVLKVRALKDFQDTDVMLEAGELYDVVMAMDTMYVIRSREGREILVPKTRFETPDATKSDPKKV